MIRKMLHYKFMLIDRDAFLKWRNKQTQEAKERGMPEHYKEMGFRPESYLVLDAGDDIICDGCGALVTTKNVMLWIEGDRVECTPCLDKYFMDSKIEMEDEDD